jgi:hypothetical protein
VSSSGRIPEGSVEGAGPPGPFIAKDKPIINKILIFFRDYIIYKEKMSNHTYTTKFQNKKAKKIEKKKKCSAYVLTYTRSKIILNFYIPKQRNHYPSHSRTVILQEGTQERSYWSYWC